MRAVTNINPERENETLVSVYDKKTDRLICWGGVDMMTGKPYIVFTPPHGIPHYSVKQERLFKVFMLAAHIQFTCAGEVDYSPPKVFDAYKVVFPREHYPFGTEQVLPEFHVAG
jgi:hypothetical protein